MTSQISIQEAQTNLVEIIHQLTAEDEVVITEDDRPVARLKPVDSKQPRRLGTLKGTILYMAPDFDAPLDEFQEYME